MSEWVNRRMRGLPRMTPRFYGILQLLAALDRDEAIFLEGAHPRTINALTRHDWIVQVRNGGYRITGRGKRAYTFYSTPKIPQSDLCSRCDSSPRLRRKNGALEPYCLECRREVAREEYHRKGNRLVAGRLCSRCNQRLRAVSKSGKVQSFCSICTSQRAKEKAQLRVQKAWRLAEAGTPFLCSVKDCVRPVHLTATYARTMCLEHFNALMRENARKRRIRKVFQQKKSETPNWGLPDGNYHPPPDKLDC